MFPTVNLRRPIKWSKVTGAAKYVIYGNECGRNNKSVKLKTTRSNSITLKKILGNKLKPATSYKFRVTALDKNGKVIAKSIMIHAVTDGGKRGNPTSIKITAPKNAKKTVKAGKKFKIKAKAVLPPGKKAVHGGKITYESSNPKVAAVTSKGVVKAKKAGKCKIYVYGINGKMKTVTVTVK